MLHDPHHGRLWLTTLVALQPAITTQQTPAVTQTCADGEEQISSACSALWALLLQASPLGIPVLHHAAMPKALQKQPNASILKAYVTHSAC